MLTHTFIPTNIFLLTESLLSSPDQTDYDVKKIRLKELNVFRFESISTTDLLPSVSFLHPPSRLTYSLLIMETACPVSEVDI